MSKLEFLLLDLSSEKEVLAIKRISMLSDSNFLDVAYDHIGCKVVEVLQVEICGKIVDAWCDEEFLINHEDAQSKPQLVFKSRSGVEIGLQGKVLLAGCDEEGETVSVPLTNAEFSEAVIAGDITATFATQVQQTMH